MKSQILTLTPELAEKFLKKNTQNRKLSEDTVAQYANAMIMGHWQENGIPIIIDRNGVVKDGQHRLKAVIKAAFSYNVPLITEVAPDVMHTIDTGKQRSLVDVLTLHKFKNANELSALTKKVVAYNLNNHPDYKNAKGKSTVTNTIGLEYVKQNNQNLQELIRLAANLHGMRKGVFVISRSDIAFFLYVIDGYNFSSDAFVFMKFLLGIRATEGSATSWLHNKLMLSKTKNIKYKRKWILAMVIKAWNNYITGDIPVTSMTFDIKNDLPEVCKLP